MKTYCLIVKKSTTLSPSDFFAYPHYFDTMEQAIEYMDSLTQAATHFESHMTVSLYEIDMEVPASDATKLLEEVIL